MFWKLKAALIFIPVLILVATVTAKGSDGDKEQQTTLCVLDAVQTPADTSKSSEEEKRWLVANLTAICMSAKGYDYVETDHGVCRQGNEQVSQVNPSCYTKTEAKSGIGIRKRIIKGVTTKF